MTTKRYTLDRAANLFGVSSVTLRRWLRLAKITPDRQPGDCRYRWLTVDQVGVLAREHCMVLIESHDADDMALRLLALEQKVEELTAQVEELVRTQKMPCG